MQHPANNQDYLAPINKLSPSHWNSLAYNSGLCHWASKDKNRLIWKRANGRMSPWSVSTPIPTNKIRNSGWLLSVHFPLFNNSIRSFFSPPRPPPFTALNLPIFGNNKPPSFFTPVSVLLFLYRANISFSMARKLCPLISSEKFYRYCFHIAM